MAILPKAISRFNETLIKIPKAFFYFYKNRKANPQIHMESQKVPNIQNNLEGNTAGGLRLSYLKTYYEFKPCGTDKDRHANNGIGLRVQK